MEACSCAGIETERQVSILFHEMVPSRTAPRGSCSARWSEVAGEPAASCLRERRRTAEPFPLLSAAQTAARGIPLHYAARGAELVQYLCNKIQKNTKTHSVLSNSFSFFLKFFHLLQLCLEIGLGLCVGSRVLRGHSRLQQSAVEEKSKGLVGRMPA